MAKDIKIVKCSKDKDQRNSSACSRMKKYTDRWKRYTNELINEIRKRVIEDTTIKVSEENQLLMTRI